MKEVPPVIASWVHREFEEGAAGTVGAKALGLLALPKRWVPCFIILTNRFRELREQTGSVADALDALPDGDRRLFERLLADAAARNHSVLVRSNGVDESVTERGVHNSYVVPPERMNVADAIERLLVSDGNVLPIVQQSIEPGVLGHLSNERRVSRERSIWLVEGLPGTTNRLGQVRIRARQTSVASVLTAHSTGTLTNRLREVAGWLINRGEGYYHCEWVWDGQRLWIVQADPASPAINANSANTYITQPILPPSERSYQPSVLQHFLGVPSGCWRKLDRPQTFHRLGLPTANIFVLEGKAWWRSELDEHRALRSDLEELSKLLFVVRCDLGESVPGDDIFLPTSSPTQDPDHAIAFMARVARQFDDRGLAPSGWAFLIATLVPARASAMVYARPGSSTVRVDALWGFPDGLQCYPHDTYFYDLETEDLKVRVRYKSHCIIPGDETWQRAPINPPLDWTKVLSDLDIALLAHWGRQVSSALAHDVQLMALAQVGGRGGTTTCLPWHYTNWTVPPYSESALPLLDLRNIAVVSSRADLDSVLVGLAAGRQIIGIRVHPEEASVRDVDLLREIARFSAANQLLVYFEGSLLSHAFYVLASEGAAVVPVNPEQPPILVKRYDKLVRDHIPFIIRRAGGLPRVRTLAPDDAVCLLSQKLIEEAFEVWNSSRQDLAGELADVLEVIDALRTHARISADELTRVQTAKRENRGGFSELLILEETASGTLPSAPIHDGALPLWDDATPGTPPRLSGSEHMRVESEKQGELLRVNVPLVPPIENGRPLDTITGRVRGIVISATYTGSRVVLSIRTQVPVAADQLSFFLEE